jgi:hypothetical protein
MRGRARLTIVLIVVCCTGRVLAHGLLIDCSVQPPDRVVIAVYYSDFEPAADAAVSLLDEMGNAIADGTTDDEGVFACTAPPGRYVAEGIIAGHAAECEVVVPGAAADVERAGAATAALGDTPPPPPRGPGLVEVLAGVAVILSAAALVMTAGLQRRLRAIERRFADGDA